MSKEELSISLLKSEQSIAELCKSKSNSIGIEEIQKNFDVLRNDFSKEKIKEIRKKFYEKEKIDKYISEQEKKTEQNRSKTRRTRKKTLHQIIKKVFKKNRFLKS